MSVSFGKTLGCSSISNGYIIRLLWFRPHVGWLHLPFAIGHIPRFLPPILIFAGFNPMFSFAKDT